MAPSAESEKRTAARKRGRGTAGARGEVETKLRAKFAKVKRGKRGRRSRERRRIKGEPARMAGGRIAERGLKRDWLRNCYHDGLESLYEET